MAVQEKEQGQEKKQEYWPSDRDTKASKNFCSPPHPKGRIKRRVTKEKLHMVSTGQEDSSRAYIHILYLGRTADNLPLATPHILCGALFVFIFSAVTFCHGSEGAAPAENGHGAAHLTDEHPEKAAGHNDGHGPPHANLGETLPLWS